MIEDVENLLLDVVGGGYWFNCYQDFWNSDECHSQVKDGCCCGSDGFQWNQLFLMLKMSFSPDMEGKGMNYFFLFSKITSFIRETWK